MYRANQDFSSRLKVNLPKVLQGNTHSLIHGTSKNTEKFHQKKAEISLRKNSAATFNSLRSNTYSKKNESNGLSYLQESNNANPKSSNNSL